MSFFSFVCYSLELVKIRINRSDFNANRELRLKVKLDQCISNNKDILYITLRSQKFHEPYRSRNVVHLPASRR